MNSIGNILTSVPEGACESKSSPQGQNVGVVFTLPTPTDSANPAQGAAEANQASANEPGAQLLRLLRGLSAQVTELLEAGLSEAEALESVAVTSSALVTALEGFEAQSGFSLISALESKMLELEQNGQFPIQDLGDGAVAANEGIQALLTFIEFISRTLQDLQPSTNPSGAGLRENQSGAANAVHGPFRGPVFLDLAGPIGAQQAQPGRVSSENVAASAQTLQQGSDAVVSNMAGPPQLQHVIAPEHIGEQNSGVPIGRSPALTAVPMRGENAFQAGTMTGAHRPEQTEHQNENGRISPVHMLLNKISTAITDPRHDALNGGFALAPTTPNTSDNQRPVWENILTVRDVTQALGPDQALLQASQRATANAQTSPETNSKRFTSAIVRQIQASELTEGQTRIKLSPRGLGNIEIDLRTGSDGTVSVVLRAENPTVLNSLREERDLLALAIGEAGAGELEFQDYTSGENGDEDRPAIERGLLQASADTGVENETLQSTNMIGNGQLDLMT